MSILTDVTPPRAGVSVAAPFEVRNLSPYIGSEVIGIDLTQLQSEDVHAGLRQLLWDRGVIFLHDQNLSPEQQLEATTIFGKPQISEEYRQGSPHPGIGVVDSINEIAGRVSRWHADITSQTAPPTVRILQAHQLPELGGDTLWASAEAAYEQLSPPLKRLADELTAVHAITPVSYHRSDGRHTKFHWAEHPVVRVHPVTGRRSLFVNPRFTQEIVGLRPHESAALLKVFYDHLTLPEFQARFQWRKGSLAIWDNRTTIHYAADDYGDARRIMYSSSIEPELPIGLNGIVQEKAA
jgi:taurine dioxygenase